MSAFMKACTNADLASTLIVIVDDDAAVRAALKFSLQLEGFSVVAFASGEALLAENVLPIRGYLIIDYFMPCMNGIELLSTLRERNIHLPAIIITTKATPRILALAQRAGATLVLEKPLDDSSLIDCIRRSLPHYPSPNI